MTPQKLRTSFCLVMAMACFSMGERYTAMVTSYREVMERQQSRECGGRRYECSAWGRYGTASRSRVGKVHQRAFQGDRHTVLSYHTRGALFTVSHSSLRSLPAGRKGTRSLLEASTVAKQSREKRAVLTTVAVDSLFVSPRYRGGFRALTFTSQCCRVVYGCEVQVTVV